MKTHPTSFFAPDYPGECPGSYKLLKSVNPCLPYQKVAYLCFEEPSMKTLVYCLLVLGIAFLHPRIVSASDTDHSASFSGTFQKLQKDKSFVSDDSPNLNSFFDDNLSD